MSIRSGWLATAAVLGFAASAVTAGLAQTAHPLPPLAGAEAPRVVPALGDDGIYHQAWFMPSFLDLADDAREAEASGKRFAVIFEQRGCVYCTKMHTEVLALKYVNDYVRENFVIVQLDLWGAREVTDFDGTKMPEKKLAESVDVWMPMTYFTFRSDPYRDAFRYTDESVARLRKRLGNDNALVHPIGGIADQTSPEDYLAFLRAVKNTKAIGYSVYDFNTTSSSAWTFLRGGTAAS